MKIGGYEVIKQVSRLGVFVQLMLLLIVAAGFWLPLFMKGNAVGPDPSSGALFTLLLKVLPNNPIAQSSAALIFVLSAAFLIYLIGTVNDLVSRSSLLAPLLLVILLGSNKSLLVLSPVHPTLVLLLLAIYTLMNLYGEQEPYRHVFSASMFLSVASMFYPPAIYVFTLIYLSFLTYRILSWREWFIAIIGYVLPYLYLFSWYFWNDTVTQGWNTMLLAMGTPGFYGINLTPVDYVWLIASLLMLLVSSMQVMNASKDKVISIRRKVLIMINFLLISLMMVVLSGKDPYQGFQFLSIPLAFFAASAISLQKKTFWYEMFLSAYLILIILLHIFN